VFFFDEGAVVKFAGLVDRESLPLLLRCAGVVVMVSARCRVAAFFAAMAGSLTHVVARVGAS